MGEWHILIYRLPMWPLAFQNVSKGPITWRISGRAGLNSAWAETFLHVIACKRLFEKICVRALWNSPCNRSLKIAVMVTNFRSVGWKLQFFHTVVLFVAVNDSRGFVFLQYQKGLTFLTPPLAYGKPTSFPGLFPFEFKREKPWERGWW